MFKSLSNSKICCLLFLIIGFSAFSQENKTPDPAWIISPSIAIQSPDGDFADRFGINYTAGIGFGYKTKQNWTFTFNGHFMFGNDVQNSEQILKAVITENNNILNQTGNYAQVSLLQRGFYFLGETEKIFSADGKLSPPSVISNLVVKAVRAKKPRIRYVAGKYSSSMLFARKYFSDRFFDKLYSMLIYRKK